jgi:hypothetical protein
VNRGARQIQARERRASAKQLRSRTEDELLIELAAAAGQITSYQAVVLVREVRRQADGACQNEFPEAGREFLDPALDPVARFLAAEVRVCGRVRIGVQRVLTGGRPAAVVQGVLADHEHRFVGQRAGGRLLVGREQGRQLAGHVNHSSITRYWVPPRHWP